MLSMKSTSRSVFRSPCLIVITYPGYAVGGSSHARAGESYGVAIIVFVSGFGENPDRFQVAPLIDSVRASRAVCCRFYSL